ncbi:uncharacterized protein LOC142405169 isoform X2 [Mycteria americana]|uniref:uncharacterized protein LOC142405169 isoform X2 n=1 Tax=Mycteria americana TaxID=33587 RepID=UPI003F581EA2
MLRPCLFKARLPAAPAAFRQPRAGGAGATTKGPRAAPAAAGGRRRRLPLPSPRTGASRRLQGDAGSASPQPSARSPRKEPEPWAKPCSHGQSKTPSGLAPCAGGEARGDGTSSAAAPGNSSLGAGPSQAAQSMAVAIRHAPIPVPPGDGRGSGMRLLLVGKSGAGKSTTGNTLLGERVFKSELATKPVTVSCARARGRCDGEDITVIDTADIFDPRAAISEVYKEITRCVRLSSPGPHALLLVAKLGQFIKEDKEAVQRLQDIFGVDVLRHTIVVLTHAEDLAGRSLHDYLRYCSNGALQDLILQCGSRNVEAGRVLWRSSGPSPAQAGSPRAGCPGPCPDGFWTPPGMETPPPLWAAWASTRSPSQRKSFPMFKWNFTFPFVPTPSRPGTGHHLFSVR